MRGQNNCKWSTTVSRPGIGRYRCGLGKNLGPGGGSLRFSCNLTYQTLTAWRCNLHES